MDIVVPDLGDFKDVEIIEIHVEVGTRVALEDALITVESDKASLDIPAPASGIIRALSIAIGDKINQGDQIAVLDVADGTGDAPVRADQPAGEQEPSTTRTPAPTPVEPIAAGSAEASSSLAVKVPDIGDFKDVEIIEIHVEVGARVALEDALITVESDKASLDIPAPASGIIRALSIAIGDKINQGDQIAVLDVADGAGDAPVRADQPAGEQEPSTTRTPAPTPVEPIAVGSAEASSSLAVKVPDIGDFKDVEIIEIHVEVGARVALEDALITVESDKASLDIPAPASGIIRALSITIGDKINQGDQIAVLDVADGAGDAPVRAEQPASEHEPSIVSTLVQAAVEPFAAAATAASSFFTVKVPDLGDFSNVEIIDVAVRVGTSVSLEDPLLTLETDKAATDIPSPRAGIVSELLVQSGVRVSAGTPIAVLEVEASSEATTTANKLPAKPENLIPPPLESIDDNLLPMPGHKDRKRKPHASPAVRKIASECGADLGQVTGTGPHARILKGDLLKFIKARMKATASTPILTGFSYPIPNAEAIDFSAYGPIEERKLPRIKKISAPVLHRNWLHIPHITLFDEVDITELEAYRKEHSEGAKKRGFSLSILAFLAKACAATLALHTSFNSSLAPGGASLIIKKYCHIGFAVDTAAGLVVPVVRDVASKSLMALAEEIAALAKRARKGGLSPREMSGGCFTISSLGGISGTNFTQIVNYPEAAILGVSRARLQPFWDGSSFVPRLFVPLALSFDHRIVDGAEGARFFSTLASELKDFRSFALSA